LPVGQGAFYVEQFEDGTNVVYDCGTSTNVEIINDEIQGLFEMGEQIKAIFISHVHEDHINGLPYLLRYCNVEAIYLPYIRPEDFTLMRLIFRLENANSFAYKFLSNPRQIIEEICQQSERRVPSIIYVLPTDEDTDKSADVDHYITSGKRISLVSNLPNEWVYVPFNFREERRLVKFREGLVAIGINFSDLESVVEGHEFSRPIRDLLREAYRKVPGDLNTNSMVVYSGPTNQDNERKYSCLKIPYNCLTRYFCCNYNSFRAGCLYTGDYDASGRAKWSELHTKFSNYWNYIGTVQIPHHGSKHNYNTKLSDGGRILVISSGCSNKYRHPHTHVLKDIIGKRALLCWVTDEKGSLAMFNIYLIENSSQCKLTVGVLDETEKVLDACENGADIPEASMNFL